MFRLSIHLCLIACLLACPTRCLTHGCGQSRELDQGLQVSCCDACEGSQSPEDPSSDSDSGCDCGQCICHGALASDETIDIGTLDLLSLDIPLNVSLPIVEQLLQRVNVTVGPPRSWQPNCGRDVCIAHQSLLI
ncbi:hypothetical protein FF011L_47600 [Roseimaritima multifibrata]|uniref:Uncharacterized protein n=1 Tax=Roseimaritima multifibrata TaxID=1930274 RepID=A0A517MM45_9BACT|nr:hypothetical protein [Roseimaritima multifibrata]QDS95958.1 hypothetical protein FF011L_47600 [Roseimaritima multifibrata]